jgi:hypothetical protein
MISKKHKDKHPGETPPALLQDEKASQQLYECKACKFSTLTKGSYKKHEATKRHIQAQAKAEQTKGQAEAKAEQTKDQVPAQQGQAEQTQAEQGQAEQGQAEQGQAEQGQAEQTQAQQTQAQTQGQAQQTQVPLTKEVNKERKKRFKHHMGALRLLQELSSGKITENDIAEYMKKHHPDTIGVSMSDDDDDDDDDDGSESKDDVSDSEEEPEPPFQNRTQENTEEPETFTFYINGPPPTTPPPVPHVRHQPYYYEFPPETPGGKLPTPPTDYKLPLFIENRRKIAESNDPEVEAQQYADIRQFIIDFLDGTQTRTGPDVERFRWQLNEITKLFVHNNMNNMQNRPNLPGII